MIEALAGFNRVIALNPNHAGAHFNRGKVLEDLARFEEALANFNRAIALQPAVHNGYFRRGNLLSTLKQWDDALVNYERVIALKPDFAQAHLNRGHTLCKLNRVADALVSYDRAIELVPNFALAYSNRGHALQDAKRLDEALASYDRAIELKPDFAEAHWGKSTLKLLTGDYAQGWELHEWRLKTKAYAQISRTLRQPQWLNKEPVSGKTLLIHTEIGLGDTIQLCRYVPMVEKLNAQVILEAPSSLVTLLSTLGGNLTIVEKGEPLPDFDLHCPTMSLPWAFKTTIATVPANIP